MVSIQPMGGAVIYHTVAHEVVFVSVILYEVLFLSLCMNIQFLYDACFFYS